MLNNGCENVDGSFIYHKDYKSESFQFKLYDCDMIAQVGGERKISDSLSHISLNLKCAIFIGSLYLLGPLLCQPKN